MSVIPTKFRCDYERCEISPATYDEATLCNWFVVAYSPEPKFVSIFPWASQPTALLKENWHTWHACSWHHATLLQSNAAVNL